MKFTKMQGLGNDYVYVNCFEESVTNPAEMAVAISDRHFGVGSDGLILIEPSEAADCRMRMYNADGSQSEMCGNGIRCVGKYVYDRGVVKKNPLTVETLAGIKTLKLELEEGKVKFVTVNMGEPILDAESIPMRGENQAVLFSKDTHFTVTGVSMGNPHGVIFVPSVDDFDVEGYGRELEVNPAFPKKANIEFIEIQDGQHTKMRVWERGTGETLACGTGACASVVAGVLNGKHGRSCHVTLLGGQLDIHWDENDNCVYMKGPAEFVFDGTWIRGKKTEGF